MVQTSDTKMANASARALDFDRDGAMQLPSAVADHLDDLAALFLDEQQSPGRRLVALGPLRAALRKDGPIGQALIQAWGCAGRAVRAVLFDKSAEVNWALGWHQDRTICVQQRIDVSGFGPWTVKNGLLHVEPPFAILQRMITVRLHLDPVGAQNGPLLIAPGSHRFGKLLESQIPERVVACGSYACFAQPGDAWLYSTPILHASDRSSEPSRRRVLQVDLSPDELPAGLRWLEL
jgi:hypothetical protein